MPSPSTYLDEGLALALALANCTSQQRRGAPAHPPDALTGVVVRIADPAVVRRVAARMRQIVDQRATAQAAALINAALGDCGASPQLVEDEGGRWRLHLHPRHASAETLDVVKAASGLAALMDSHEWSAVKACGADRCDDVFVDRSRNRVRRYCSRTCANRVNADTSRARRRS